MGTCPPDFERGLQDSCHVKCPADFKYMRDSSSERCVYATDNSYSVSLNALPTFAGAEPSQYENERSRFKEELRTITETINTQKKMVSDVRDKNKELAGRYGKIQSDYATYSPLSDAVRNIKTVSDSLKPFRPPTAPSSDIEIERKAILAATAKHILLLQVALFVVFLSLLTYLVVPIKYAHSAVFLILCVGIAVGIFLSK